MSDCVACGGQRLRAIVFADIEGCTLLMHRLGDAAAVQLLQKHERVVRDVAHQHDGVVLKGMGDGFMVSFESVTGALKCAIALQVVLSAHNRTVANPINVRVGVNAGEPIATEGDLFGTSVVIAQRVSSLANGGQVFVSEVVRQLACIGDFKFERRGRRQLKGVDRRIGIFELRWNADAVTVS